MHITDHAIRRYKQRFGAKRMSADKAKKEIRKAIAKDLICVLPNGIAGNKYICTTFVAVVKDNTIITVHDGSVLPDRFRVRMLTPA